MEAAVPDVGSLYPPPPQPQQNALSGNPLQLLSTVVQLQKARSELVARQAIGNAYQKSMNSDGTLDLTKAQNLIAADPNAAYSAPQAASDILAQRGQIIANGTAQFQQGVSQNAFLQNLLGTYADKKDLNYNDVLNGVVTAARNTNMPSHVLIGTLSGMPQDSKRLRDYLVNMRKMAIGSAGISEPGTIGYTQAGAPVPGTRGQFLEATAPGAGPSLVPPPPGSEASTAVMQADLARAGNYGQDVFPLQKALDLAKSLGPGGMGPGTEGRQKFESYLYSLMPELVPASMQNKIKNYAELEKYLVNNTQQRAQNLGPHTNEGLATNITGSPNVHINDLAGVDLIKAQLAVRKMEQAQIMQASKGGGPTYTKQKATAAAQLDPRAFMIEHMEPQEIAKLQKTLKGPERARFNASLRAGIDSGAITPPNQ